MSFQAMAWAYRQRPEGTPSSRASNQHHVLMGLANYATQEGGDDAVTFVGAKKLAQELCMDERTIRRAIDSLESQGLVSSKRRRREDGSFSTSTYTLPIGQSARRLEGDPPDSLPGSPSGGLPGQEPQANNLSTLKPVQPQALAPTSSSRAVDPIFEELFMVDTLRIYSPEVAKQVLTDPARASLNKAAGAVRKTGITREELHAAIGAWGTVMGDATCTANAVAKHLPRLLAAADGNVARAAQPSDEEKVLAELRRRRELKEAEEVSAESYTQGGGRVG